MAIIREYDWPQVELNEQTMIEACARLYDVSYYKFRNFYYLHNFEADLFLISKARYATEIEIKVSLADWKADLLKKKHQNHKYLKHFYYAVPEILADKAPDGIDERYGLITIKQGNEDRLRATIVKHPQNLGGVKVPTSIVVRAFKSCYYKQHEVFRRNIELMHQNKSLQNKINNP